MMLRTLASIALFTTLLVTPILGQTAPEPTLEMRDDTMIIKEDRGGPLVAYMDRYIKMKMAGAKLAIDGACSSSCTLFFGYLPQKAVCVTKKAKIGIHRASTPEGTTVMMMKYPEPVLMWMMAVRITEDVKFLPDEMVHGLFKDCPDELINPPAKPEGEKID